jgi:hypothetical protein
MPPPGMIVNSEKMEAKKCRLKRVVASVPYLQIQFHYG